MKISKKIGIDIDSNILEKALPFLDLRHVLVHEDGKPSKKFLTAYHEYFKLRNNEKKLRLSHEIISKAYTNTIELISEIDKKLEIKKLI